MLAHGKALFCPTCKTSFEVTTFAALCNTIFKAVSGEQRENKAPFERPPLPGSQDSDIGK